MFSKDWVSVKFGRDVASLIHFHGWKLLMDVVNSHYTSNLDISSPAHAVVVNGTLFNWRRMELRVHVYIFRKQNAKKCANLPKNYISIRELY